MRVVSTAEGIITDQMAQGLMVTDQIIIGQVIQGQITDPIIQDQIVQDQVTIGPIIQDQVVKDVFLNQEDILISFIIKIKYNQNNKVYILYKIPTKFDVKMDYIRLESRKKGASTNVSIYAISTVGEATISSYGMVGNPPYYRVRGVDPVTDELVLTELKPGSYEHNKVRKWVGECPEEEGQRGQKLMFNFPEASCHVTKEKVIEMLSE